jgi:hypothetical protein
MATHGLLGIADAGAFLARLTRLDHGAPVRLRSARNRTALWARLPWDVLVTREVAGLGPGDATVSASELLNALARTDDTLPVLRDAQWRWPLPPAGSTTVETVAASELTRLAAAAAGTLREVTDGGLAGRSVGRRAGGHPARRTSRRGVPATCPGRLPDGFSRTIRCGWSGYSRMHSGALGGSFCTIWSRMVTVRK